MSRLIGISAILLLTALFAQAAGAEPLSTQEALSERVLGDPAAPITIIEYASLTCPHCAAFHAETMPRLEKEWIDTGKAKLIYRDFPTNPVGLAFAGAMIARCAPKEQYFTLLGVFYASQGDWTRSTDPIAALSQIARLGGMSEADVKACLDNGDLLDGLRETALDGQSKYGVDSTPSFVINGRKIGNLPYDEFVDVLEKAGE